MFGLIDSISSLSSNVRGQERGSSSKAGKAETSCFDGMESSGFQFHTQPIPDIIAYCFGDEKGEKKLKEINQNASRIDDNNEKKKYIEDQLREYTKGKIDNKISGGLKENFFGASEKYQQAIREGKINDGERLTLENAGSIDKDKDPMFGVLKGLGLNIDSENCRTDYQEIINASGTRVKMLSVSFVNRPTTNIIDPNSQHRQLASTYADTLNDQEKRQFQESFNTHTENAKNGQPKMSLDDFNKSCTENLDKQSNEIRTHNRMDMAKQQASAVVKDITSREDKTPSRSSGESSILKGNSSLGRY